MLSEMMKEELVHGLREIFHENMRMIILYGSVAREESTPESDIDIAIIMREEDIDEETKEKFFKWSIEKTWNANRGERICKNIWKEMLIINCLSGNKEQIMLLWKFQAPVRSARRIL